MSLVLVFLVVIVVALAIASALLRSKKRLPKGAWPFFAKKPLTQPEQVLYFRLVRALPESACTGPAFALPGGIGLAGALLDETQKRVKNGAAGFGDSSFKKLFEGIQAAQAVEQHRLRHDGKISAASPRCRPFFLPPARVSAGCK